MYHTKTRIVIADDNIDFVFLLNTFLSQKQDMEVVGTATNGSDAINIITETTPDVVIMDIVMPMLDGIGVLEKLKSYKMHKEPIYIILSALAHPNISQIALSLGAEYFFMKPFDPETLVSRIRQLLYYKSKVANNKTLPHSTKELQHRIIDVFDHLGVPIKLKGYQYLIDAIIIVTEDMGAINSITKKVYPEIAEKHKISPTRVERAIRNAIEVTWARGNLKQIHSFFETDMLHGKTRPSNSDFITKMISILLNSNDIVV